MKLEVTSKKEGFRRGGRAWSTTAEIIDTDDFNKKELAAIKAEPMLVVTELTAAQVKKLEAEVKKVDAE